MTGSLTGPVDAPTVQVRLALGRRHEIVDGPDGAAVTVSIAATDAGLDPAVAYMQGRLKVTGHTGALFELLRSGAIARAITRLTSA